MSAGRISHGHSRKKELGKEVLWNLKDCLAWANFSDFARTHHRDIMGDALGHCNTVRNEEPCQNENPLNPCRQGFACWWVTGKLVLSFTIGPKCRGSADSHSDKSRRQLSLMLA